jgi:uncharacterized Zn finger protein
VINEAEFSTDVLNRAKKLPDSAMQQDETYREVWWVTGSRGDKYRIQFGKGFVTCTCPHGLNAGAGEARCYHVAAVLMNSERRRQYVEELIARASRES